MKKLLLLSAIAVFGFSNVNAQEEGEKTFGFEKGSIIVEGNLGFNSSKTTDSDSSGDISEAKNSGVSFNPKAGFFISEKLALGIQLNINSTKNENTDLTTSPNFVTESKGSTFGAGVFARYYFLDLGKRFKTYTEFGVGFNSTKNETTQTGATNALFDTKGTGIGAGLSLGMNYFVTECFAINFMLADVLSFQSMKTTNELPGATDESKNSSFNGNLNVFNNFFQTAQFGLTYKF